MFLRIKSNKSGNKSIQIIEKTNGQSKVLKTIGCTSDETQLLQLINEGKQWISDEKKRRHPEFDLLGEGIHPTNPIL